MKIFWHFFLSNLRYNKIELAISYVISAGVLIAFHFLSDPKKSEGDILFSVAFYALLYAFYSNKKKYNLKYMLSLPLSKSQLLATKVLGDLVYFLPAISLGFWGAMNSEIPFDVFPLIIILMEVVLFVSFIMFDSDIEQPRLENARSSFLNRLIYVRKMADFFFLAIFVMYVSLAVNLSPISMGIKQYLLILLLAVVLCFKFNRSLKLMKDESMSYFMPKRDLFKIGWKVAVFAVPAVVMYASGYQLPSKYGKEKVFSMIEKNKLDGFSEQIKKVSKNMRGKTGYTLVEAAIESGNTDALDILLENDYKVNWNSKLKMDPYEGVQPLHLAVKSGEIKMVEKILSMNEESMDSYTSEYGTSPLQISVVFCKPEITEYLLQQKSKVNYQNKKGNTALILSTANKCHASTSILLEYDADPNIQNNDKKTAFKFVRASNRYLLTRKSKQETKRLPASVNEKAVLPKLLRPKLLRRQKLQN